MERQRRERGQQSNVISLHKYERRQATESDKWCQKRAGKVAGDIVAIPYDFEENIYLTNVDGCIVRIKKQEDEMLLQIIQKESAPQYGIKVKSAEGCSRKDSISIKNLSKSNGKWGK